MAVRNFHIAPLGRIIAASWSWTSPAFTLEDVLPLASFPTLPSITGDANVGDVLSGVDGTVRNGAISARRWLRDGTPIAGATTGSYTLSLADLDADIQFENDAISLGGTVTATSTAIGPVQPYVVSPASVTVVQGPGTGSGVAALAAGNLNTFILQPFEDDGTIGEITVNIATAGAGNVQWKLVEFETDGTVSLVHEFAPVVWNATGAQTYDFGDYAVTKGQALAFRRAASTSAIPRMLSSAANGFLFQATGDLTGSNQARSVTVLALQHTITRVADIPATAARQIGIAAAANDGYAVENFGSFARGNTGQTVGSASPNQNGETTMSVPRRVLPESGLLERVSFNATIAGHFQIAFFSTSGGNLVPEYVFEVFTASTGWQDFLTDREDVWVEAGWRVGVLPSDGSAWLRHGASGTGNGAHSSVPVPVVWDRPLTPADNIGFFFNIEVSVKNAPDTTAAPPRTWTEVTNQTFPGTSTPASWAPGTWTVNNGLVSPATASATARAEYSGAPYTLHRRREVMEFTVNTASTSIRTGIAYNQTNGGAILMNCASGAPLLEFGSYTGSAFTAQATKAISFTVAPGTTTGRTYRLTVEKDHVDITITLEDIAAAQSVVLTTSSTAVAGTFLKGEVGPLHLAGSGSAGDVTVTRFRSSMGVSAAPEWLMMGDSLTEGSSKLDDDVRNWAHRIDDGRNLGDVAVCGVGGTTSVLADTWVNSLTANLTPANVIIKLGTNDTNTATWRTRMASIIAKWVAKGANVYLATLPPRASFDIVAKNADIRSGFFGAYPVIDFSAAVSVDEVTWNAGAERGDAIHYSTAGEIAVYNRAVADVPGLLT